MFGTDYLDRKDVGSIPTGWIFQFSPQRKNTMNNKIETFFKNILLNDMPLSEIKNQALQILLDEGKVTIPPISPEYTTIHVNRESATPGIGVYTTSFGILKSDYVEIIQCVNSGRFIEAIKYFRKWTGLSLSDGKKWLKDNFPVYVNFQ